MHKIKRLTAIMALALVASMGTSPCFAGDIQNGIAGPTETPGIYGIMDTPGFNGQMETPAPKGNMSGPSATGDMSGPGVTGDILLPGLNGWMSTGLYMAIASLFE
jgi:hypothetical protein